MSRVCRVYFGLCWRGGETTFAVVPFGRIGDNWVQNISMRSNKFHLSLIFSHQTHAFRGSHFGHEPNWTLLIHTQLPRRIFHDFYLIYHQICCNGDCLSHRSQCTRISWHSKCFQTILFVFGAADKLRDGKVPITNTILWRLVWMYWRKSDHCGGFSELLWGYLFWIRLLVLR